jgi:hypothetical protein
MTAQQCVTSGSRTQIWALSRHYVSLFLPASDTRNAYNMSLNMLCTLLLSCMTLHC